MWVGILNFITANNIGDLASLAGVVISLVGFAITVVGVIRSKRASERAEAAARAARDSIRVFDMVVDFAAAITTLEDLKRAHRTGQWQELPDRYAAIRKVLITLRSSNPELTERQQTVIQEALANLRGYETSVERALVSKGGSPNAAKFNSALSKDIDELVGVLNELKITNTGAM